MHKILIFTPYYKILVLSTKKGPKKKQKLKMVEIEEGETDAKASKWLLTCRPTTNTINTKNTFIFDGQERLVIHLDLYCLQPYRIPYSIIYSSCVVLFIIFKFYILSRTSRKLPTVQKSHT